MAGENCRLIIHNGSPYLYGYDSTVLSDQYLINSINSMVGLL